MFNKTKTVAIFGVITLIIVIVGFVLIITRKQTVNSATGEVKSYWKKPAAEKETAPAA